MRINVIEEKLQITKKSYLNYNQNDIGHYMAPVWRIPDNLKRLTQSKVDSTRYLLDNGTYTQHIRKLIDHPLQLIICLVPY